jgi:hypothetical protein
MILEIHVFVFLLDILQCMYLLVIKAMFSVIYHFFGL